MTTWNKLINLIWISYKTVVPIIPLVYFILYLRLEVSSTWVWWLLDPFEWLAFCCWIWDQIPRASASILALPPGLICSLTNVELFGALMAALMPIDSPSNFPGPEKKFLFKLISISRKIYLFIYIIQEKNIIPILGTCWLQYTSLSSEECWLL